MREALEQMRDDIVKEVASVSKDTALFVYDEIGEMIERAIEGAAPPSVVNVAPISMVRDMLNECLSNALTPLCPCDKRSTPTKNHGDSKRNAKKRTKVRKLARKVVRKAKGK